MWFWLSAFVYVCDWRMEDSVRPKTQQNIERCANSTKKKKEQNARDYLLHSCTIFFFKFKYGTRLRFTLDALYSSRRVLVLNGRKIRAVDVVPSRAFTVRRHEVVVWPRAIKLTWKPRQQHRRTLMPSIVVAGRVATAPTTMTSKYFKFNYIFIFWKLHKKRQNGIASTQMNGSETMTFRRRRLTVITIIK